MTARYAALSAILAALLASSALAVAQEPAEDMDAPGIEEPTDGEGGPSAMPGDEEGSEMRGPGRRAGRMMGRIDADGSGDITLEEFGQRRIGWVSEADANGDGVVAMDELTAAIEQRRQERREARLLQRFDIDGDGEITVAELERHQEKRFALMDRNDDGVLSRDEMHRRGMEGRGMEGRGMEGRGMERRGMKGRGHHGGGMERGWHHR